MEAKYNQGLEFYFRIYIANQSFRYRALVCREGRHETLFPTIYRKIRKIRPSKYERPLKLVTQKTLR